ncbi:MAG: type III pantothenate kinase [Gallionellaceae bacterium]|nr:type III pantothenate kinase [Gallionellaceae bacterium]
MLLIDSGNSRIKWKLVENGTCIHQGIATHAAWEDLRRAFSLLPQPHKIIVSNVAGSKVEQNLREACAIWPAPVEFLTASDALCGVRNGYEQPAQLGSDRWAALIAAWHNERSACLVVNCGTATTVDMLSNRGEFTGGLILPGVEMMQRSLCEGTAGLKRAQGQYREFPLNTANAIVSGAIQATVGAIRRQFGMLGAPSARCLLSGGAAGLVAGHLDIPFELVDDLVLRGLQIIGQETKSC